YLHPNSRGERRDMSSSVRQIGQRYEIEKLIGSGAVGRVYLGRDAQTGECVAIKELMSDWVARAPEAVERFRREGEALRKLNHPNIVKVLAALEENDQHFLVMEYVGGGSLADLLKRRPQLPVAQVISLGLELSDALSRAHHLDIIHRDIKPGNILLAEDGTPRLTDFGLAHLGSYPALTTTGQVLGTFQYLSPEACENQALDARADIWSFGVVLFEMLTGQRPFDGDTPLEIIHAIQTQPVPEVSWTRQDVPAPLADLVRRMLMRDRPVRLASARLVGAELEALQRGLRISPPPDRSISPQPAASAPTARIKVLLVDDHAVVRQGLRTFLELQDDMQIVGEAANGMEAIEQAQRVQPDIVLLDLAMPKLGGVEATPSIIAACPQARVIILTSFGEDDQVIPAIRAGAQGYLLKDIPPHDLVQAVREAYQGKAQLHPDVARKLMSAVAAPPAAPPSPEPDLTERELEVLRLIAQGLNNQQIAQQLTISEKTVKTHVSNILGKLHVDDRTQAAIYALKKGL
ncbi:MAG TPA: protein kinase, partial [Anaerolineae bacterium]|nr:protein kinase [Anaerolineae bacterium]